MFQFHPAQQLVLFVSIHSSAHPSAERGLERRWQAEHLVVRMDVLLFVAMDPRVVSIGEHPNKARHARKRQGT